MLILQHVYLCLLVGLYGKPRIGYLIYASDVADAEGDGVDVKPIVLKRQLLRVPHHPRQT